MPRYWPTLLLFCLPALAMAEPVLDAPPEIVRLVAPHLPETDLGPRKLHALVSEILATEGYFSPQLRFSRSSSERSETQDTQDTQQRQLTIDPGPRTRITQVHLQIDGAIDPARRDALIASWRLPVGQPFRQTLWNDAKQDLLAQLLGEDHPAARLLNSQARIDADSQSAELTLQYDAGPRYVYRADPLIITGLSRYSSELIAGYNRSIQPGAPYREADLNQLQSALQTSPYFSAVEVQLERAAETGNATAEDTPLPAAVKVSVRERPAHRISLGAGVSSNTGMRGEFAYATPNFINRAWDLHSGLRLEQKRQTLYADIFLPPDQRDRRHSFGLVNEVSDIQGLRTVRQAIGAQRRQMRGSIEQLLSLNWLQERRSPDGAAAITNHALVPDLTLTWRQLDSLIEPRKGTVLQLQIGGALRGLLSDTNFLRTAARIQHYLPLGQRDHLLLRGEIGHTRAGAQQRIPQDYLFRSGGAGSVRGYSYQSLGIKEGSATVGGRYLSVLSAEYTHWLADSWENWGIASFVDAGDVSNSREDFHYAMGYGLGARWRSPAGPIGVDIAYGQRTHSLQLHFSLAIPF